jgi:tetratricopeptide (TPR) repeat protein
VRLLSLLLLLSLAPACANTTLVLPFFNRSGEANLDWIGESAADAVRESLAAYNVLALEREDRLEGYRRLSIKPDAVLTRASIIKVGHTLDAAQVIYGFYTLAPPPAGSDGRGVLRITARILDLRRTRQGPEFMESGPLEDLAALVARLGWQSLQFIAPKQAPSEQEFRAARPPVRVDAVESYIRGLLAAAPEQKHRYFTQAARLDERYSQPAYQLGRFYWQTEDYRVAAGWLERVSPGNSHYRESQFLLGLCRYYLGAYAEAEAFFEGVARTVPLNEVWNNLGAAQSRQNSPAALGSYRKALEGDDADPDYHFNVGYVLWKQGDFEAAAQSFRAALERDPEDAEATLFLGYSIKQTGPRPGDTRTAGRERLKHNYDEAAYRQLQAELTRSANAAKTPGGEPVR